MTTQTNPPRNRNNILIAIGLASISVLMYVFTWLKDWS